MSFKKESENIVIMNAEISFLEKIKKIYVRVIVGFEIERIKK